MKGYLTFGFLLCLLFIVGCNSDDSIEQAKEQSMQQFEAAGVENMENDALFAAEAVSANMLLVQLSDAAVNKGVSPEVKNFAQRAESTHRQMNNELEDVARQTDIVLPQTLGNADQKIYDELMEKEGIAFDVAFIRTMREQHKELLRRYDDIAENGTTMELKQFASRQLPLLRQHEEATERLEEKIE
ncbi:DUF4142 domain-containing protein [Pontibacter cellulosilyticus]|uniref:DUF4142 domain-containing protein n=1 Tax=Pontibacter cellulosilyticus TaxID=1720253 RepID=A0A923SKH5_9BACT|nr:DUF4142 domain-containing protein [Pontibacter cellulosilyticus]MBC5994944.1 DUF4142 domain-containing protein [Pontibacter cellulosilyticus]